MVEMLRLALVSLAFACNHALAQPVKHVGIYVHPYYSAAENPSGTPQVAVAKAFDARLATNDPSKIKEVEKEVRAQPDLITPMTLMVLAIRLYDTGFRDDSVFWFYAAKDRMKTLMDVMESQHPAFAGAVIATKDFAATAGYTINGYAFCHPERQATARRAALEWVQTNPYKILFIEALPAKPGDRQTNLNSSIASITEAANQEQKFLAEPGTREKFANARQQNGSVEKYCWK